MCVCVCLWYQENESAPFIPDSSFNLQSMRCLYLFFRSCVSEMISLKKASLCSINFSRWSQPMSGSNISSQSLASASIFFSVALLTRFLICSLSKRALIGRKISEIQKLLTLYCPFLFTSNLSLHCRLKNPEWCSVWRLCNFNYVT